MTIGDLFEALGRYQSNSWERFMDIKLSTIFSIALVLLVMIAIGRSIEIYKEKVSENTQTIIKNIGNWAQRIFFALLFLAIGLGILASILGPMGL